MIPNLALIVAAYVITRMLQILVKQNPKDHPLVVGAALVTIAVTLISMGSIISGSMEFGSELNQLLPAPIPR